MESIKLKAFAKINLSLDIVNKREDNYHQLEMIMQSIKLADIINIKRLNKNKIKLHNINADLPEDRSNLAYKAAELILNESKKNQGVKITIKKNIPIAAGLGGGSSDAAAVLKGINKLFKLNLSFEKLKELGSKIGMDIPFCLQGGTALATGKGNIINFLPDIKHQHLILVKPSFSLSTASVYEQYDDYINDFKPEHNNVKEQKNCRDAVFIDKIKKEDVPTESLINIIKSKKNIEGNEGWANVLEPVAEEMVGDIKNIKNRLKDYNPKLIMMTGSGPTVFAIVNNKKQGQKIKNDWPRSQDQVYLTSTARRLSY